MDRCIQKVPHSTSAKPVCLKLGYSQFHWSIILFHAKGKHKWGYTLSFPILRRTQECITEGDISQKYNIPEKHPHIVPSYSKVSPTCHGWKFDIVPPYIPSHVMVKNPIESNLPWFSHISPLKPPWKTSCPQVLCHTRPLGLLPLHRPRHRQSHPRCAELGGALDRDRRGWLFGWGELWYPWSR